MEEGLSDEDEKDCTLIYIHILLFAKVYDHYNIGWFASVIGTFEIWNKETRDYFGWTLIVCF